MTAQGKVGLSPHHNTKNNEWGDLPDGWEVVKLGDLAEIVTGGTPNTTNNEFWNGDTAWITPTDIKENKDMYFGERNISEKGLNVVRKLPLNSLLITCIASIGKNAILRNGGACNQQINAIIPNDNFDIDFLYYFFESKKIELRNMAGVTATPIISKALFATFPIIHPPKPEQTAIATVLSDTDKLIDSLTALIAKKQAIKSATMSQLLSGQKRLPELANHSDGTPKTYIQTDNGKIPEDWEMAKLGEICEIFFR
ncbi:MULTISPECIES: restriction endonuclease subunit S [unclassified Mannheimia]|uniref:restriction endonuclease subunit S n=1 Tax=unclassified Mannheimia TaxID=2645054 RepID=UPI00359D9348